MRSVIVLLLIVGLAGGAVSCATRSEIRGGKAPGLDRKLSTFTYVEEGDLVTFIVNTRAARNREQAPYMPLEIAVANRGVKHLTLTRESFTLVDQEGNRYPCAGPKELLEGYEFLDMDRNLAEIHEIVFNRFATFTLYPSSFTPTRTVSANPFTSNLVRDSLTVPRFGYFIDFIYFPKPKTGVLNKRFDLFMSAPELKEPVFVKFGVT